MGDLWAPKITLLQPVLQWAGALHAQLVLWFDLCVGLMSAFLRSFLFFLSFTPAMDGCMAKGKGAKATLHQMYRDGLKSGP